MDERRKLTKIPKGAYGGFKAWLRQRSPWLADIWRLRRTLKPGTLYGHFHEGYFPRIGKLQRPIVPYREMVRRRYADLKVGMSRLEATLVLHLRCGGYPRKQVEEEMLGHMSTSLQFDPLAQKFGYIQRALGYAFGAQGDKIILDKLIGRQEVEMFNKEAEIIEYYSKNSSHFQNHGLINRSLRRMR